MKANNIFLTVITSLALITSSGCVTGMVARPDLKMLVYDDQGVLRYNGKKVDGIKLELPWYQEMWPDSPSEWGFTLLTAGVAAAASGGGGGGSEDGEQVVEAPVAVTTASASKPNPKPKPEEAVATTSDGGGSGGGGGGGAPPAGGGIELPF